MSQGFLEDNSSISLAQNLWQIQFLSDVFMVRDVLRTPSFCFSFVICNFGDLTFFPTDSF